MAAQLTYERSTDTSQEFIAGIVTKDVIDLLKVIPIQQPVGIALLSPPQCFFVALAEYASLTIIDGRAAMICNVHGCFRVMLRSRQAARTLPCHRPCSPTLCVAYASHFDPIIPPLALALIAIAGY